MLIQEDFQRWNVAFVKQLCWAEPEVRRRIEESKEGLATHEVAAPRLFGGVEKK